MHLLKAFKNFLQEEKGAMPLLFLVAVIGVVLFLVVGFVAPFKDRFLTAIFPKNFSSALSNPAVTQQVQMQETAALPLPQNVKAYPDDRVATVTWDNPSNMNGIVGFIVVYGKTADGAAGMINTRQTTHNAVQIQPLENGVPYTVEVRSVQGNLVTKANHNTPSYPDEVDTYAVASGPVSPPVTLSLTPTSARVDAMRSQLTGFFDDFNMPSGAFDELKWNHAATACSGDGTDGQFINGQFHAHNQTFSKYCDRDGNVSRPRAVLDIAGRTEANPALIEFDMDGVSQPRDVWYIDLIPLSARKNNIPLDVTSHNDNFDTDHEDPGNMLRINQHLDNIHFSFYDSNLNPTSLNLLQPGMPCQIIWTGPNTIDLGSCDMTKKTAGLSPLPEPSYPLSPVIPNVRRHWVIQFSQQKLKLFIDGTLLGSADIPAAVQNETKWVVQSTLFSYNTGKQYNTVQPTTSILHWDNFGMTAPLSGPTNLVTHNYLDSSPTGAFPWIGRGMPSSPVPEGARSTKINIPDQIGTPVGQARLMFTLQPFVPSPDYVWNASHTIVINGHTYAFPNPALNFGTSVPAQMVSDYVPMSTGIYINPADLKQGLNDVAFNIPTGIINVHLELDYDKSNAPAFTQPKDIFGTSLFNTVIQPAMAPNDDYWFVEQYMGLATAQAHNTPLPTTTTTPTPVPTVNSTPTPVPTSTATPVVTPTPTPTPVVTPVVTPTPIVTPVPTSTATPLPTPIPTAQGGVGVTGSVSVLPTTINPGGSITISWNISNASAWDWIGFYQVGLPDDMQTPVWGYTSSCLRIIGLFASSSGSCTFTLPSDLPTGTYEARLYTDNSWSVMTRSSGISVSQTVPTPTPAPTVTVTPTSVPTAIPSAVPVSGSTVTIWAAGTPASGVYPSMRLDLFMNGSWKSVKSWGGVIGNPANRQFVQFTYNSPTKVAHQNVRVNFTNDAHNSKTGEDRNLMVDKITIDGVDYQSEAATVYSTGSWAAATGCKPGFKSSEWLSCNGYFEYR